MRNFGAVLLLLGVLGFFVASRQLEEAGPVPAEVSLSETLASPAGRWELARYGCGLAAAVGLLLALFPKGR